MHFQLLVYGNIKEYDDKSLQECHKKNTVKTVKYKSRTSHSFNVASTFQAVMNGTTFGQFKKVCQVEELFCKS